MAAKVAHGEGRKGERSWPISKLLDPRNQVKLERGRGNVHMGDMIDCLRIRLSIWVNSLVLYGGIPKVNQVGGSVGSGSLA